MKFTAIGLIALLLVLFSDCSKDAKRYSPSVELYLSGEPTFGFPKHGSEGGKLVKGWNLPLDTFGWVDTTWDFMGVRGGAEFYVDTLGRLLKTEWSGITHDTVLAKHVFRQIDTSVSAHFGWTLGGLAQHDDRHRAWYTDHGITIYRLVRSMDTLNFSISWYDSPTKD
jgi:hypothetical protein